MSAIDIDKTREQIWDHIFKNGTLSIDDIASQLGLSVSDVMESIDCEWFSVEGQQVSIAPASN